MSYISIFNTKPKKENKIAFCKRIVDFLNNIELCNNNYIVKGEEMLNVMFKYSPLNIGYSSINDLLNESELTYESIFNLSKKSNNDIKEDEILVNIDIIINCFYTFKTTNNREFHSEKKAKEICQIMFESIEQYLITFGYKIIELDEHLIIIESGISIDFDEINDKKLKEEVISFYNYKNENDIDEKKKIILNIIGKLETKRKDIGILFGDKIAEMIFNYANNINLRHNNSDPLYKQYYRESVALMSDVELVEWYNYIFAFVINIYFKLNTLKNINISNNYRV